MGYPAYVVRIHSLGGGASLAAAALGYAEGKVAAVGHSFLWWACMATCLEPLDETDGGEERCCNV